MKFNEKLKTKKKSIMILGTSSGAGKSLTVTAICRILKNLGEEPIPFKGQNMSNNAWVDREGGEMAYSQAIQAFAAGKIPSSEMNPILLKPQGDSISEIIHLGKSVGISSSRNYYKSWFDPGWKVIKEGIKRIYDKNPDSRLIIEGAGSPVEMNLIHRDLTNLRIAKYLNASCILVADIERGGVFAQIVGTLELMLPEERNLIKGIIITRFRGDLTLFNDGKSWIEKKTKLPVLGVIPWLNGYLPAEDSLDLLNRNLKINNDDLKIGIIKFPSISNFSDIEPLENLETISLEWLERSTNLKKFDLLILPGSKQTIKDKLFLDESGLLKDIKDYAKDNGNIFGICGGLQMLGEILEDPSYIENSILHGINQIKGLGLLPLRTIFHNKKETNQITTRSIWPSKTIIKGFEIHNGETVLIKDRSICKIKPMFTEESLGWYLQNDNKSSIAGTYIHGIFENDNWRINYLNLIRENKDLPIIDEKINNFQLKRDKILDNIAVEYSKHCDISPLLN